MMEILFHVWLYIAFGVAGGIFALTISGWRKISLTQKLLSFTLIGLVCHMFEERIFPGGFAYIFNVTMGSGMQNQLGVLIANPLILALIVVIYFKFSGKVQSAILVGFVGVMELVLHVIMGVNSMKLFEEFMLPYSPGLFTSLFILLPIGIVAIVDIAKNYRENFAKGKRLKTIGISFLCILGMAWGCILLPQLLTGNFTQFNYPNNGIYDLFIR